MRAGAVGVDDDLPAGEAAVAHRAADHELAGRVDEDEAVLGQPPLVVEIGRQDRAQDVLDQVGLDLTLGLDPLLVLRRHEHTLDLDRPAPAVLVDLVADRHLRLAAVAHFDRVGRIPSLAPPPSTGARALWASMIGECGISSGDCLRGRVAGVISAWSTRPRRRGPSGSCVARSRPLHLERRCRALGDAARLLVERHATTALVSASKPCPSAMWLLPDLLDPLAHEPRTLSAFGGRDRVISSGDDDDEAGEDEQVLRRRHDPRGRLPAPRRGSRVRDLVLATAGQRWPR